MNWLESLFVGEGIAHSILILSLVIALGTMLGKIKVKGISLGVTWILFLGIAAGHFGWTIDSDVMGFVKEFGLILFVFSIGLEVGPGFFSSFRKGGLSFNLMALLLVSLSGLTTYIIHLITGTSMSTMVGIMSGAVTNTPGLGAAQQTFADLQGFEDPTIAMGYAVTYPLGVLGVIFSLMIIKRLFRINLDKEKEDIQQLHTSQDTAKRVSVEVLNDSISGMMVKEIVKRIHKKFIFSRIIHPDGRLEMVTSETIINKGDKLLIVTSMTNEKAVVKFLGQKIEMDLAEWERYDNNLVSRRLIITRSEINGKRLSDLNLRAQFAINITRINRSGVDLVATPDLILQIGDRVTVIGEEKAIDKAAQILGNSLKRLNEPNLIPIFVGIFLGVILGSIPIFIPHLSQPLKLGLAGGPLIVAILIARFGPNFKMVTYTTISANMMLREVGISLFLAAVGLGAGEGFVNALFNGGYMWILYGAIITIVPVMIISIIGRYILKYDYFSLSGMICGGQTNPIALAFMNNTYGIPQVAVSYATVYPLTMFLRVLIAQLMV